MILEHSGESYRFSVSFLELREYEAFWLRFHFSWKQRFFVKEAFLGKCD